MSLKPPWKQKNPVMEKACPAYYKNTAPAKAVRFIEKLKAKRNGALLAKEIVFTGKGSWENAPIWTVVLFKEKKRPVAVAFIKQGKETS